MEQEIWKEIPGLEGRYEASTFGNIRMFHSKKNKSSYLNEKGYLRVDLAIEKKVKHRKVHRLIALTFIPNPLNKSEVNHLNGLKTDNRVLNLEWSTGEENNNHAILTGLNAAAQIGGGNKKLKLEDVRYIIDNKAIPSTILSKKFSVNERTIREIKKGTTYKRELEYIFSNS